LRRTSRLLVVFGIGLAVLTFVLILALFPGGGQTPGGPNATATVPTTVTVVVAAADIPLGTPVTADMLSTKVVSVNAARADAYQDPSQAIGQVARRPILSGGQVGNADFALIQNADQVPVPVGKKAMAISVSELTGVGKLVYPGDTVDLVISLDSNAIKVVTLQPPNKSPYGHDDALNPLTVKAPVLLQGLQVLATIDSPEGQAPAANGNGGAAASPAPTGPILTGTNKLIILAVTDSQAEAILYARTIGTIDLVLRNTADAGQTETTDGVILKTLFDKYGVLPPYLIKAIDAYVPNQP
jgi:pilus assembly protein CpaB